MLKFSLTSRAWILKPDSIKISHSSDINNQMSDKVEEVPLIINPALCLIQSRGTLNPFTLRLDFRAFSFCSRNTLAYRNKQGSKTWFLPTRPPGSREGERGSSSSRAVKWNFNNKATTAVINCDVSLIMISYFFVGGRNSTWAQCVTGRLAS